MNKIDTTDTDYDGLYDIYETAGMKIANGNVIHTDPNNSDTDKDGLLDGREIMGDCFLENKPELRKKLLSSIELQKI